MYQGEKYNGERTLEALHDYVLSQLATVVHEITPENWDHESLRKKQWLLFLCAEEGSSCPEPETRTKLAAIFVCI